MMTLLSVGLESWKCNRLGKLSLAGVAMSLSPFSMDDKHSCLMAHSSAGHLGVLDFQDL